MIQSKGIEYFLRSLIYRTEISLPMTLLCKSPFHIDTLTKNRRGEPGKSQRERDKNRSETCESTLSKMTQYGTVFPFKVPLRTASDGLLY